MSARIQRRTKWLGPIALAALLLSPLLSGGIRLEPSRELLSAETVAIGLQGPRGMAMDPKSSAILVAESAANRISIIRDKAGEPLLERNFQVSDDIPKWVAINDRSMDQWREPVLRSPCGLSFDAAGNLYVAEAAEFGRLLRFDPLADGLALAHAIPTPWIETGYGYTSVFVDDKNRIFATAQEADPEAILSFGSAMMRETNGHWWLIDYGPFAEFANVAASASGDTVAVGEHRGADVSWYDTTRQVEIGAVKRLDGLRHLAFMPNGTLLISLKREDGTWSVVEVDPSSQVLLEWVGGLTEIGGIFADPDTSDVYVSLAAEGKIMKFSRLNPPLSDQPDKLIQLTRTFELEMALPPKDWPEFFRSFIEHLGVIKAVNEPAGAEGANGKGSSIQTPLTMGQFAAAVPVVAAKVKVELLSDPSLEADPIEEISFIIFYPNHSALTRQTIAPSISLFRARHRSGRVVQTRFMPNAAGAGIDEDTTWDRMPEVLVSFPSGYYAPDTGVSIPGLLRAYFLGMGLGPDYWIDIDRNNREKSHMLVEKTSGQKIEYRLTPYPESIMAGGESVLVAGVKAFETGWYYVGSEPILWSLINGDPRPMKFKHGLKLAEMPGGSLPTEASIAAPFDRKLSDERIGMYRKLVLRAASRWSQTKM